MSDGAIVLIALLCADAGVTALVPPDADPPRISGDALGQNVALPALRVWKVSSSDLNIPAPGTHRWVTQRVQVEAHAENVPQAKALLRAVRRALADRRIAEHDGLTGIKIHTAGEGPEGFSADTGARVATQDFRVAYNEER